MKALLRLVLLFLAAPALAHPGWGIVVDPGGTVYYTDLKQVWRIAPDGAKTVVVPDVHTHELYLDPEGTLHGEHLWYDNRTSKWGHYIWELTDGKLVRHPTQQGLRVGGGFVRDGIGNTYWLDGSRLRKRTPGGEILEASDLPRPPDKAGQAPGGILAAGEDDAVYVASGGDLLRVGPDGKAVRMATHLDDHVWTSFMTQPWHYVMGLAPDSEGNVYVANSGARKVKKVAPDGTVTVVLQASFPWAPTGIAVHARGVYVLEYTDTGGSVRVRRIERKHE